MGSRAVFGLTRSLVIGIGTLRVSGLVEAGVHNPVLTYGEREDVHTRTWRKVEVNRIRRSIQCPCQWSWGLEDAAETKCAGALAEMVEVVVQT